MARDYPEMRLRLPPELKRRINQVARANKRSMQAEILSRIEASFAEPMDLAPELRARVDSAVAEIRDALLQSLQEKP